MSLRLHEPLPLLRDVPATQIPSGLTLVLAKDTEVMVTQALGGNLTVSTPSGYLARIDAKDADALGEDFVASMPVADHEATPGTFDEARVWDELRTVYDPEIPVNIVDLGLIYSCVSTAKAEGGHAVDVKMSMTAPGCGMGDILKEDVRRKILALPGVADATVEVVWEPPWDQSRMSEAARLQLGWM